MVPLMNKNRSKILFLVEGERLEKNVFEEIAKVYKLKSEIFCLKCNIFMLYNLMKSYDFNASIKDILIEKMIKDISNKDIEILKNNKFAYTYIIMDLDLQHYKNDISKGIMQVEEMCDYFSDETDDTIGKLYINYPMMESFRDRDDFVDEKFNDKVVHINDFVNYKRITSSSKLSAVHINNYGRCGFDNIIKSNINKASIKLFDKKKISYKEYLFNVTTPSIYKKQMECIKKEFVYVLNTSIYFVLDYFGEKYFDEIYNISKM